MNLKNIILLAFLIPTGYLKAQSDFRPAYLITLAGDTLTGEVDYRGDLMMSGVCRFKGADDMVAEFFPGDIAAFRFIDSKFYVSRKINGEDIFLEYLIMGEVSVYYARDKRGDHYFLQKKDGEITELPYEEGVKYVDNKRVQYQTTRHIGILNYYMQDAPGFQSKIETLTTPEHRNLIKLAEEYHYAVCEDEQCIIYEKQLPMFMVSIEPALAVSRYKGFKKLIPELGGYLYIWAPRTSENLYFKTGIRYSEIPESGGYLKVFKVPAQLQYIYRAHKIQPRLSFGINFLTISQNGHSGMRHTISLNPGLNYRISESVSLTANVDTDYTPLSNVLAFEGINFHAVSYALSAGLFITL